MANIYLHEVLDKWFVREVQPRMAGRTFLVRYADDFVIICEYEQDAKRIFDVLPKRLNRFGLEMHPEKTRMVDFRCPPPPSKGGPRRGSFDLLGFTHYWGLSRQKRWTVKRKTAKSRLSRTLKRFNQWCRRNRHMPVKQQHQKLSQALIGHDAYYGITGNGRALEHLRYHVRRIWRKWLARRSHKAGMIWEKAIRLFERYPLPPARVVQTVYGRQQKLPLGA